MVSLQGKMKKISEYAKIKTLKYYFYMKTWKCAKLISKALIHTELKTTRICVNVPDFAGSSVYDSFALTLERAKVMK